MKLKFQHIQFHNVVCKALSFDKDSSNELKTKFEFKHLFDTNNLKQFGIEFSIELESPNGDFQLHVKATAHFITDEDINEAFKASQFVKISAPSIAFPYVRTFISNFTLNSGYNPVVLPTFNFIQLGQNNGSTTES